MRYITLFLNVCVLILALIQIGPVIAGDCSKDSEWTSWGPCSPECGTGSQHRRQKCDCKGIDHPCRGKYEYQYKGCTVGDNLGCYSGGTPTQECIDHLILRPTCTGLCDCPIGFDQPCCRIAWKCPTPAPITNGIVTGDSYYYNSRITYVCEENYKLTGSETRTCQSNKQWSGWTPSCSFVCPCQNSGTCSRNDNLYECSCPKGYIGKICQNAVSCGSPPHISYGSYYPPTTGYYQDERALTCDPDYAVHGGDGSGTIRCEVNQHSASVGAWSTPQPECSYDAGCRSSPCLNDATCENGLNTYKCHCHPGWAGPECQADVQPPIVESCPNDIAVNATQPIMYVTWAEPVITDPHHTAMRTTANYPQPGASLPWGVHTVFYTSTKLVNSLSATCQFTVSVLPTPCEPFSVPAGGALACNGWNSHLGVACAVFCEGNSAPPNDVDITQLLVCGSRGSWYPPYPAFPCSGIRDITNNYPKYERHFFTGNCLSEDAQTQIKKGFLATLSNSSFSQLCTYAEDECIMANVDVACT